MQRYTKTGFDPAATIWMKATNIDALAALMESESARDAKAGGMRQAKPRAGARSIGSTVRAALERCLGFGLGSARG